MELAVAVIVQHKIARHWWLHSLLDSLRCPNDSQHAIERHLGKSLLHS